MGGFIFSARENPSANSVNTFANGYQFTTAWNFCNGVPDTTSLVRVYYR